MKLCPFCAEEIQDAAIVCKHCGRDLPAPAPRPKAPSPPPAPEPKAPSAETLALRKATRRAIGAILLVLGFLMSLVPGGVGLGFLVLWVGLGLALPGGGLARWGGGVILALVLASVASGIGGGPQLGNSTTAGTSVRPSAEATSARSAAPAVPQSPPPPPQPSYDLALMAMNCTESESGSYHYIQGQVKNVSEQPIKNVTAVGIWMDKTDEFITSDDSIIDYNPILPGQTSSFKTISTGNPAMARCRVEFKTIFGGTLRVDDQRKKRK